MSDVVTFNCKGKTSEFTISAEKEFLTSCPNPSDHSVFDLNSKFFMFKFLHNPSGPAVIRRNAKAPLKEYTGELLMKDNDRYEYWIKGKLLNVENKEQALRLHHAQEFNKKLEDIVNT